MLAGQALQPQTVATHQQTMAQPHPGPFDDASGRPPVWFASGSDAGNGRPKPGSSRREAEREDLPFKVELWNAAGTVVEQVLAVTANGSIGYAAYYAATREHPDRYITLRHKNRTVSRWNGPRQ